MDPRELRYQVDNTPQVLPTFGNVAASFHDTEPPTVQFPGIDIELSKVLHASEAVTVPTPLPASGSARSVTRFTEVWDKGKAAVIVSEASVTDLDGKPLWNTKRSIFARGEGGFGGERGPSTSVAPPDRAPDMEVPLPILPQQALRYRLCTRIPNSPRQRAFRVRSCTACAPTWCARRASTHLWTAREPRKQVWRAVRRSGFPGEMLLARILARRKRPTRRQRHRAHPRRRGRAVGRGADTGVVFANALGGLLGEGPVAL